MPLGKLVKVGYCFYMFLGVYLGNFQYEFNMKVYFSNFPNFFMKAGPGDMMCSYVLCLPVDLT